MIVAHLSDLHLGHEAFDRTENGRNVRERDVAEAFGRAVQRLVELAPDVVLLAGDVFDRPDPPPIAVATLSRGLETLRRALPAVRVVMVAGPRDGSVRSGGAGVLDVFDAFPGVHAASNDARALHLEELDLVVWAVPTPTLRRNRRLRPRPDPNARWNVLLAHARIDPRAALAVEEGAWDYVALGYEHRYRRVTDRIVYSGSLERVGGDPWSEAAVEKGFVTFDLEKGRAAFHPVPCRPVVLLAPLRIRGGAAELERRVSEVVGEVPGGVDGKIVRLVIQGIGRSDLAQLPRSILADLRARTTHFRIDVDPGSGVDSAGVSTTAEAG